MRRNIILFALVLIVSAAASFFLVFKPQSEKITETKANADAAEAKIPQLQAELRRREGLKADEPRLRAEAQRFNDAVPDAPQLSDFIRKVQEAASGSRVNWMAATHTPPTSGAAGVQEIAMTITVDGGYLPVKDFITRMEGLGRAVKIGTVDLTSSDPNAAGGKSTTRALSYSAKLGVKMFVSSPSTAPPAAASPASVTPAT
ncbi:MAG: type 4a pilus biogenesis protein PilO [Actinomycetota bacterium]